MFNDIIKPKNKYTIYDFSDNVRSVIKPFDTNFVRDSKTLNSINYKLLALFKKLKCQGKIKSAVIISLNNTRVKIHVLIGDRFLEASWFFFHGVKKTIVI